MKTLLRLMGARLPRVHGDAVAAVHAPVTIRRDAHGVPYVEAQNDHDGFFGLGYAQGQDRGFQLELFLRVGRGTVSALVGKEMLDVDRLSRRLGFRRIAQAQLAVIDPAQRAHFDAFVAGVNAGVAAGKKPHELALVGGKSTPYEAVDILTVLQFLSFALSSNWDAELARLRILQADGAEALAALEWADPALLATEPMTRLGSDVALLAAAEAFAAAAASSTGVAQVSAASNNWVLAPARTSTGRPLLACDPHLGPTMPAPWYLAHVRTPDWAISGAFFPGQPVCTFGHNEKLAWGLTAGHADNTDLVVEKLRGDTVLRGSTYVACEVREETIAVKGAADVVEKVVVTPSGPIVSPLIDGGGTALSIRATWMAPGPIRAYGLYRATTVAEARALFRGYPAESENRLFADVNGSIGWQLTGDVPVRKKGHGLLPMPGWDLDAGWERDPLPFEQMPHAIDPPEGFLATANAAPPAPTRAFLGADWLDGARHQRVHALLAGRHDWDIASTMAMQMDRTNVHWSAVRAPLLNALAPAPRGAEQAARLLQAWDGVVGTESAGAAVFELLFAELMCRASRAKAPNAWRASVGEKLNEVLEHGIMGLRRSSHLVKLLVDQPAGWFSAGWPEEIRAALVAAEAQLRKAGGDDWKWGHVRPLTLMHAVGKLPVLKGIFNVGPLPFGGDGSTIPQASTPFDHPLGNPIGIPNLRMVLDVGNWEASRWVVAGGESGNPLSPHYADQVPLWQGGEGIAMAWSPASVRAAAKATLQLRSA